MITSADIIKQLTEALEKFGTHAFYDKGPDEVMNIDMISIELKTMTAEEVGTILKEVAQSNPHGQNLIDCIIQDLDTELDDWFEKVIEISGAEY